MRNGTLEARGIWKRFRSDARRSYLQEEVKRLVHRFGSGNGGGWRWALRDIEFIAEPGESIGLIGANGSGKTTLLKILARVMYPTAGHSQTRGRIGALLAVAQGLHPNLTGRENIGVTGSLLGLSRKEVAARFDDIVAFAEIEDAIDRQTKYYSAGMLARLGFGIASSVDPDILLVDEVLAVGDASFQQKCLDRMREVLGRGTTLVFVSHDLAAIEATCSRGIWLHDGEVVVDGRVREVLSDYRRSVEASAEVDLQLSGRVNVVRATVSPGDAGSIMTDEPAHVDIVFRSEEEYRSWIYVGITEGTATPIFVLNPGREKIIRAGETHVRCSIRNLPLPQGRFYIWVAVYETWTNGPELVGWRPVASFDVHGPELDAAPVAVVRLAPLYVDSAWSFDRAS